jgi:hypothetical protein
LRVSDRPDSGLIAVSTDRIDVFERPIARSDRERSPKIRCLRPFSEKDRPTMSGLMLNPSPNSCSDGRCECIFSVMLKMPDAALTSCAITTAF